MNYYDIDLNDHTEEFDDYIKQLNAELINVNKFPLDHNSFNAYKYTYDCFSNLISKTQNTPNEYLSSQQYHKQELDKINKSFDQNNLLNNCNDSLTNSLQDVHTMEEVGTDIMLNLYTQKDQLLNIQANTSNVTTSLTRGQLLMNKIKQSLCASKAIIGAAISIIIIAIIIAFIVKFNKK